MPNLSNLEQDVTRVRHLFEFDKEIAREFTNKENPIILGIDEVGRGPIAGPLAAGGVIFKTCDYIQFLNDSKKVTEKRRPIVAEKIKENSKFFKVSMVDAKTIDDIGISQSLKRAFTGVIKTAEKNNFFPDVILIDGNFIDLCDDRVKCIVKGDQKSASIAASSIIAKVERDKFMIEISRNFPEFRWEKNKGYGTREHIDAIKASKISPYHRKTFLKNFHFD